LTKDSPSAKISGGAKKNVFHLKVGTWVNLKSSVHDFGFFCGRIVAENQSNHEKERFKL